MSLFNSLSIIWQKRHILIDLKLYHAVSSKNGLTLAVPFFHHCKVFIYFFKIYKHHNSHSPITIKISVTIARLTQSDSEAWKPLYSIISSTLRCWYALQSMSEPILLPQLWQNEVTLNCFKHCRL